jgi:hypothetical protein
MSLYCWQARIFKDASQATRQFQLIVSASQPHFVNASIDHIDELPVCVVI